MSEPRYSLPGPLADVLDKGGRRAGEQAPPLEPEARHAIGAAVATAGIGAKPAQAWMVRALRDRLGRYQGTPQPPGRLPAERDWLARRLDELELDVRADLGGHYAPKQHRPRIVADPDGYTNPSNVLDPAYLDAATRDEILTRRQTRDDLDRTLDHNPGA
jgi:hypothetical protein